MITIKKIIGKDLGNIKITCPGYDTPGTDTPGTDTPPDNPGGGDDDLQY